MWQMIQKILDFQIAVRRAEKYKLHQFIRTIYFTKSSSKKKSNSLKLPQTCIRKLLIGSLLFVGHEIIVKKFFGTPSDITIHIRSHMW